MSTGSPRNINPNDGQARGTNLPQLVMGYITPIIALIGLFVLMGLKVLDTNVGIPLVAGIVGVHGGAAITNTTSSQ